MAIIRLEQLYPFPHDDFAAQIAAYPNATEVVWCQEEPGNQGAWHRIQHYLLRHLRKGMRLDYALRPSSASPAAGYLATHNEQQKAVIEAAFRPDLDVKNNPGAHNMSIIEVKVPQLSESVSEATLLTWHKKVGEAVSEGENLIDIETDKVVLELPAIKSGVLTKIIKADGAKVGSDEVIAQIDTAAVAQAAAAAPVAGAARSSCQLLLKCRPNLQPFHLRRANWRMSMMSMRPACKAVGAWSGDQRRCAGCSAATRR